MLTRVGIVTVLGLAGVLAGCGDDGTVDETTPVTTSPAETTVPSSPAQLNSMLLEASDVGSGWQLGPEVTDADLTDARQLPCPDSALDPAIAARLEPVSGVQFEPVDQSSKHLIEFAVSGQPERLDADLQALFDAMDACTTLTPTSADAGSVTVASLPVPALGDQRAAFTLIGVESSDATWYVRSADVRVGPIGITVNLTEILRSPDADPSISDAEFIAFVASAVTKLDGTSSGLANPASVFCIDQGGRVEIVDEADGQVGYCTLPDGRRVEEWEYFRSQNPTSEP